MTLTQIATLLNSTIVPNVFGKGEDVSHNPITIAEDLRNVVDLGTALASLQASDLKNYMNDLVVGVFDTYCDTRSYKDETYDLFISEVEYGGAIQRIKAKLLSASDTAILTLDNANNPAGGSGNEIDYTDGHYWGTTWDDKVYTKDVAFKIKYSISTEMFKKSFTSAAGVQKLIAMIEANVDNTLKVELNGLAQAGEDRHLRQRPQLGPHPQQPRLRGREDRPRQDGHPLRRRRHLRLRRAHASPDGGAAQGRRQEGVRDPHRARAGLRAGRRLDLRPQLRVRQDQRGIHDLN